MAEDRSQFSVSPVQTMQENPQQLILKYLERVQNDIIDAALAKNMNATGKTLRSLNVQARGEAGGDLMANANIRFLETGRGPTKDGAAAGNPTLVEALREWAEAKGLGINPYAMAKHIHKHGTKLYRAGGNSGVLSVPLREERITELFRDIAANYVYRVSAEIYSPFTGEKIIPIK